jgi:hypothetical protein
VLLGAAPVLLGATPVLLGATPVLLGTTTLLGATPVLLGTTTLLGATPVLLAATTTLLFAATGVLDNATIVELGIEELDPGLVGATERLFVTEIEKVAFEHSNLITRLLVVSATCKKSPGNSVV